MTRPFPILAPGNRFLKRTLDLVVGLAGLVLLLPVLALAVLLATVDTGEFGLFSQERVGRHGRTFRIFKIRSMRSGTGPETNVTTLDDPRITPLGRLLRRVKLDEFPQLWNVVKGDMSLVGPRPDVPEAFEGLQGEDRMILEIRPGVTGPATLRFKDEEELLASVEDPQRYSDEVIFPEKVRLNLAYMRNYRLLDDVRYIWRTIFGNSGEGEA